jgi:hypothetical protein
MLHLYPLRCDVIARIEYERCQSLDVGNNMKADCNNRYQKRDNTQPKRPGIATNKSREKQTQKASRDINIVYKFVMILQDMVEVSPPFSAHVPSFYINT